MLCCRRALALEVAAQVSNELSQGSPSTRMQGLRIASAPSPSPLAPRPRLRHHLSDASVISALQRESSTPPPHETVSWRAAGTTRSCSRGCGNGSSSRRRRREHVPS